MTGLVILAVALAAATAFGLYRRTSDGRFDAGSTGTTDAIEARTSAATEGPATPTAWSAIAAVVPEAEAGERATLVQFSSAFCAPCRTTRVVLADIAAADSSISHVEIDAEQHLELVRTLDVRRTPTTLVLDRTGAEIVRASGAPRRDQVLAALTATGAPR